MMDKRVVVLLVVIFLQLFDFSKGVQISIDPVKCVADEEIDVALSCKLDDKEAGITAVEVFKVTRKGDKTIVSLFPNNTISYMGASEDEYKATGKIDLANSVLDVVILKADLEDTGVYNCIIQYKDGSGASVEHKATTQLKVNDPVVNNLNNTVTELENKVKEKEDSIKTLKEKEKKDAKVVNNLEVKNQEQANKLTGLIDKGKELETKLIDIEKHVDKEIKSVTNIASKAQTEVSSLNETVETLADKISNKDEDIASLDEKEKECNTKLKSLDERSQKQETVITELDEREENLEQKVNKLENEVKDQLRKMKEMKKVESRDKSKMVDLEAKEMDDEQKLKVTIQEQKEIAAKIRELELKLETAYQTFNGYGSSATDTATNTGSTGTGTGTNVDSNTMDGTGQDTPMIAFTATNQNDVAKPHDGSLFIFPDVITQWGSGYSPQTGIFTAPRKGLYLFTLLVKVDCNACYLKMQLKVNSNILFRLRVGHKYDQPQVSASSPVELQNGDQVKVYTEESSYETSVHINRFSMFSGYLINAA